MVNGGLCVLIFSTQFCSGRITSLGNRIVSKCPLSRVLLGVCGNLLAGDLDLRTRTSTHKTPVSSASRGYDATLAMESLVAGEMSSRDGELEIGNTSAQAHLQVSMCRFG